MSRKNNAEKPAETQTVIHNIPPVWSGESQILILGTMPSPKSRESGFFYMHPQNRFWPVLFRIFGEKLTLANSAPDKEAAIAERRDFLLPFFLRIPFLRDWRLVLRRVREYAPLATAGRPAKMKKTPRNDYLFPALMIADGFEVMFGAGARLRNRRRMVLLAVEVVEYRRKHGRLPESLAFLPKVPPSTLDKTPLMYAKTADGFRIFCRTDKGKIPSVTDARYSLSFRLAPR